MLLPCTLSVCAYTHQLGERSERSSAVALVLSQVMREPCFTTLRTQQQLGYIVNSGLRAYGRRGLMQGFCVRVLSKVLLCDLYNLHKYCTASLRYATAPRTQPPLDAASAVLGSYS
jgi:Peptidase M16 inactive domain